MRTLPITTLALFANIAFAFSSHATPFQTLPNGSIRHTASGFVFPKRIGVFERENPTVRSSRIGRFGRLQCRGLDRGDCLCLSGSRPTRRRCARPRMRIKASRGIARAPGSEGALRRSRQRISRRQEVFGEAGVFLLRDVFARTPQNVKSQLLVFRDGPVFIGPRFTYPIAHADKAEEEIQHFISGWSWR